MELNYFSSEKEIESASVINGLLIIPEAINRIVERTQNEDTVVWCRDEIKMLKDVMPTLIENYSIHYAEYIAKLAAKQKYQEILEFAVENKLSKLVDCVEQGAYYKIIDVANDYFVINKQERERFKNKYYSSPYMEKLRRLSIYDAESVRAKAFYQAEVDLEILMERNAISDNYKYRELILTQGRNRLLVDDERNIIAEAEQFKRKRYEECLSLIEDKYERWSGEKAKEEAYNRLAQEITDEYLEHLIEKGDLEKAIIKLCVKIEALLRFRFTSDNAFYELIDRYCKIRMHEKKQDEDYVSEEERCARKESEEVCQMLYKLRKARNSIVHPDGENDMTAESFRRYIKLVKKI